MEHPRKANYHTHTFRCQHAEGTDESYVQAALSAGYTHLGFSDHAPWPFASGYVSTIRMTMEELPGYIKSVHSLQTKYADKLPIYLGLESEYFPRYHDHLLRLRDMGLEYLILGHHFTDSEECTPYVGSFCRTDDGVKQYADTLCAALETGLFCCVAHPDLYMRAKGSDFNTVCQKAAEDIACAAIKAGVPLEFNLLGLSSERAGHSRNYPYMPFWEHIRSMDPTVILGVDAHSPQDILDAPLYQDGLSRLKKLGYSPIQELTFRW